MRVAEVLLGIHDDLVAFLHHQVAVGDEHLAVALDHDDDRLAGDIQIADALAAAGKSDSIRSSFRSAKAKIEIPQRIYPPHINSFRFPILSDRAPINTVVRVAVTADAATMLDISAADALNIL